MVFCIAGMIIFSIIGTVVDYNTMTPEERAIFEEAQVEKKTHC